MRNSSLLALIAVLSFGLSACSSSNSTRYPDNRRDNRGVVVGTDGRVLYPDGRVEYPDGRVRYPDGTIRYPDGRVRTPDGRVERRNDRRADNRIVVCHKGKTMSLPRPAAEAHVRHGDSYGACRADHDPRYDRRDDDDRRDDRRRNEDRRGNGKKKKGNGRNG